MSNYLVSYTEYILPYDRKRCVGRLKGQYNLSTAITAFYHYKRGSVVVFEAIVEEPDIEAIKLELGLNY
jgi:hypothetical protein